MNEIPGITITIANSPRWESFQASCWKMVQYSGGNTDSSVVDALTAKLDATANAVRAGTVTEDEACRRCQQLLDAFFETLQASSVLPVPRKDQDVLKSWQQWVAAERTRHLREHAELFHACCAQLMFHRDVFSRRYRAALSIGVEKMGDTWEERDLLKALSLSRSTFRKFRDEMRAKAFATEAQIVTAIWEELLS